MAYKYEEYKRDKNKYHTQKEQITLMLQKSHYGQKYLISLKVIRPKLRENQAGKKVVHGHHRPKTTQKLKSK
jgi:hypothetical protein